MQDFFSHKGAYVVLVFVAAAVPIVAGVVGYFWYKLRRDELMTSLKQEMLERGMSADDIQKVIEAGARTPTEVDQTICRLLGEPQEAMK
jgi:hypothetical protein